MLELYCDALGMLSDTPLGKAAIEKVAPRAAEEKAKKEKLPPHDPETGELIECGKSAKIEGEALSKWDSAAAKQASASDELPSFLRRQRSTEPIPA